MSTKGREKFLSKSNIRNTLCRLGAINENRIRLFSKKVRDKENLNVYIDPVSNVIFIDDYYVGDNHYVDSNFGSSKLKLGEYEDIADSERRLKTYLNLVAGKKICDFGCGHGTFLKLVKPFVSYCCGIELQNKCVDGLNHIGIDCFPSLLGIKKPLDVITLFHCFEHLPDPSATLKGLMQVLKNNGDGTLLIEVPHARDFLINDLKSKDFIDFTLWSQHLVLHTRESLRLLLADAGFKSIVIQGVQRYSLANHINWLCKRKPGGHKSILSTLQTPELISSYEMALARIDATDTLVAIATT